MVLTIRQAQILIAQIHNLKPNKPVQMAAAQVKYVIRPFEGKTNLRYSQRLKLYIQATKEIDKEAEKLDILVSNAKDIIDNFLSLTNKYG